MANPSVHGDEIGEWVELRVNPKIERSVDLNNVEFGRVDESSIVLSPVSAGEAEEDMPDCLAFAAGERVVLARSGGWTIAGLEPAIDAIFPFTLVNYTTDARLFVRCEATGLASKTTYAVSPGASWSRDETTGSWCLSTTPYTPSMVPGEADLGTPGAENDRCEARCLDDGEWRPIEQPGAGQLALTEFMANPVGDDDEVAEWFELYNLGDAAVDLNGLHVSTTGDEAFEVLVNEGCLSVAPGAHVVVANQPDVGGAPPDFMLDPNTRITNDFGQ
ncbi:MAG: lamin tail domain-containing protein, partial [Bdellovibrionaceae bacterium]|nr:lamin tail domain-containing protein [Pseudobdellovibrionaceae bacterium]